MKAIVNTTKMRAGLAKLSSVISKMSVLPILSSIKLTFEKDAIFMMGTDLETILVSKIECTSKEPFSVIIDHESLQEILKHVPDQPITITKGEKGISILYDNGSFKLPFGGELDAFPKIPEEGFLFDLQVGEDFFSALFSADSCKSKNDLLVTKNAACLDFANDKLSIVGTDGFILYKKDLKVKTGKKMQSLVRGKFVSSVKEFGSGTLSVGEKFVKIECNGDTSITRVQDNKFAGYEPLVSSEIEYNVKVNRKELINTIKVTLAAANKATKLCVFTFEEDSAKISCEDIDFEKQGTSRVRMIHSVKTDAICFNGGLLLHILNLFSSEEIAISIREPHQVAYIKSSDDSTVLCLIIPTVI
jgi:DNA polymerase III sliding clamp (beta) subunit (PCNA family)